MFATISIEQFVDLKKSKLFFKISGVILVEILTEFVPFGEILDTYRSQIKGRFWICVYVC